MINRNILARVLFGFSIFISMSLNAQMYVNATGQVGVGTESPQTQLHVRDTDKAVLMIENTETGPAKLNLRNASGQWLFNARSDLRVTSGGVVPELRIYSGSGNMILKGTLTTSGTTCGGGGCDLVFSPETKIESIEEHAAEMWSNSYLPAVGPTKENMPFNLTEKTGGMLNELEKAHIYIEQLHNRLADVEVKLISGTETNAMAVELEQLRVENQQLRESQAEIIDFQQSQQKSLEKLKSMFVDLQMQTQSQEVLASLEK